MRRLIPVAVLAVLVLSAGCSRKPTTPLSIHETRTFPVSPGKLVKVDVRSLDVHVKVADGETIGVKVDVSARASSRTAAQRWVERNTPVFEDSSGLLEVSQTRSRGGVFVIGFLHTEGSLELAVPPTCRLEVRTSSGDVSVAGEGSLANPVRLRTSSGDVKVSGGMRELIVNTTSGDVRVSGPPLSLVEANTSSGDVTVESGAERALFDTSSGDVLVKKLSGGLTATTSSGDVSATWERLQAGAKVRVRTTSGDVGLHLPAGASLLGEITTTSGRIRSDFAGTLDRREHHLALSGTGEGVEIEVHTTSGDATLRKGS